MACGPGFAEMYLDTTPMHKVAPVLVGGVLAVHLLSPREALRLGPPACRPARARKCTQCTAACRGWLAECIGGTVSNTSRHLQFFFKKPRLTSDACAWPWVSA